MKQNISHYDVDCLRKLLDDTLHEPLSTQVAEHIADCPACRDRLESLAGEPQWWTRACSGVGAILAEPQAYSRIAFDSLTVNDSDKIHYLNAESRSDESFASDFAVDFLEPNDANGTIGRLGDYEILEVIGSGGMGIVLKGYQRELNRYVAVKVLAPHLATSGAARRRFEREAQATAAVVHPHVMAIHAVATNAKLPYLVMPLIACESLQQRLDRHGPLPLRDILRIGTQAAGGLAAAHAQGLVHRDVKPANILLEKSVDRVMLTDFGLARAVDDATLTRSGVIAGTPMYMSPEQAGGEPIDHRSDLFSLGSVLYAMSTGRPPFRAETTFGVLRRIRESEPRAIREVNPDIPEWFERIVLNLISKSPDDRLDSASALSILLEQCLAHVQQPTAIALPEHVLVRAPTNAPLKSRSIVAAAWLVFVTTLLAAAAIAFFWHQNANSSQPADSTVIPSADEPPLGWNAMQSELDDTSQIIEQLDTGSRQDLNE
ncbi:MAG: serine/threonine-protein kinase [Pirellulales bacterium]